MIRALSPSSVVSSDTGWGSKRHSESAAHSQRIQKRLGYCSPADFASAVVAYKRVRGTVGQIHSISTYPQEVCVFSAMPLVRLALG